MDGLTANSQHPFLADFSVLGDITRCRALQLLHGHELTVTEICTALRLPQSTVSRHLKTLGDAGWTHSRREATRRLYRLAVDALAPASRELWELTRAQVADSPSGTADRRRLEAVLAQRRSRSREFFASAAEDWDRLRTEVFGAHVHQRGLLGLLPPDLIFADLGCGTGSVSETLAPFSRRVIAVDASEAMLEAARSRLRDHANVELRRGELEALPVDDAACDAATLILVLHHVPDPLRALTEVSRILRPGGLLVIVDALPHDQETLRTSMGHVWMGFDESRLTPLLELAGLTLRRFVPLAPDVDARGPHLFCLTAERRAGPPRGRGPRSASISAAKQPKEPR